MKKHDGVLLKILSGCVIVASLVLVGCTTTIKVGKVEATTKSKELPFSYKSSVELEMLLNKTWDEYYKERDISKSYNIQRLLEIMVLQNQIYKD